MMMPAVNLGPIGSFAEQNGCVGSGVYLLTGAAEYTGPSGQPHLQLTLEDATGRATGFVWPEARGSVSCLAPPSPVSVHASVKFHDGKPQLKVHSLTGVTAIEVPRATALLPRRRCPDAALSALDRLAELEQSLPAPLDGFLREVLLDPQITLPFLGCRASVAHHHAYPGGLLVHSTEMLDLAYDIAHRTIPEDAWSPFLTQLGYLLHDLGKLRSVGEVRRPQYGLVVRHEQLTLELLAPHLRWLELRNLELATALRYVLGYLATPARARGVPNYVVAEIVATLDQWSAASHNCRDLGHLLGHHRGADAHRVRRFPARFPDRCQPQVRHG